MLFRLLPSGRQLSFRTPRLFFPHAPAIFLPSLAGRVNTTMHKTTQVSTTDDLDWATALPTLPIRPSRGLTENDQHFSVRNIHCVGRNYAAHAREMGGDPDREPPFFFGKPTFGSVWYCGNEVPTRVIPYPPSTSQLEYEVELVIAVGVGFAVGVDLTRRDVQQKAKAAGRPWWTGKGGFPGAAPMGPVVPVATLDIDAELWLTVNGVERQRTKPMHDMVWSVPELLEQANQVLGDVQTGDLIMTGTPAGVGRLEVGDVVVAGMDGLCELSFTIGPPASR